MKSDNSKPFVPNQTNSKPTPKDYQKKLTQSSSSPCLLPMKSSRTLRAAEILLTPGKPPITPTSFILGWESPTSSTLDWESSTPTGRASVTSPPLILLLIPHRLSTVVLELSHLAYLNSCRRESEHIRNIREKKHHFFS